jgi:SAM-dependent methyltransferase
MRKYSHWTYSYIYFRLRDIIFRKLNPSAPWLTPDAIDFLNDTLKKEFNGLEYGSGRSTIWFAKKVNHLISVEHNAEWFNRVSAFIRKEGVKNIEYKLFPTPGAFDVFEETIRSDYVQADPEIPSDSLDFILVDGIVRPACALRGIPLLKPGGWLILDDANHYLPSNSEAPNSRSNSDGTKDEWWGKVQEAIKTWDISWFGNGVKETLICQKPSKT